MKTIAIITGASSGIGTAIAFTLAAIDIQVILLARNKDKLKEVASQINTAGGSCFYHECDVTKRDNIEATLQSIQPQISNLKLILINNAGYGGPFKRTDELSEEEWDSIFNTNTKAPFLFCKYLLPLMKKSGWGRVINIASIYGSVGGALSAAYAASKHALIGYTKSIAAEWGEWNITCNTVSPGFTNTKMGADTNAVSYQNILQQIPLKRQATPEEIAQSVLFLCGENSSYINGADIVIDGGLLAAKSFQ